VKARRCTRCGKTGATERHDDCAEVEHWFHKACWLDFKWWLSGHDGPRRKRD
jgi:hypothetical protein